VAFHILLSHDTITGECRTLSETAFTLQGYILMNVKSLLKILLATLLTASTLMASPNPLSETELLKSPDVISLVTRDRTDHTKCQTGERPISTTKFGRVKCSGSTSISASYLWKFYGTVGIMWALEIA
ncbi:BgTH12-04426, partial [Blumeria graminis f. sp. triticale]